MLLMQLILSINIGIANIGVEIAGGLIDEVLLAYEGPFDVLISRFQRHPEVVGNLGLFG